MSALTPDNQNIIHMQEKKKKKKKNDEAYGNDFIKCSHLSDWRKGRDRNAQSLVHREKPRRLDNL